MDIIGLMLSAGDIFLLGIAGALIGIFLTAYLQSAISRRHVASDAYKSAFADVLLNLRENPDCPLAQIAHECNMQITTAIDKRRNEVTILRRRRFERDVSDYKNAYQEATQNNSVFAVATSEKTELARHNRSRFLQAIERLSSHG